MLSYLRGFSSIFKQPFQFQLPFYSQKSVMVYLFNKIENNIRNHRLEVNIASREVDSTSEC